jgi:hypothetical protein
VGILAGIVEIPFLAERLGWFFGWRQSGHFVFISQFLIGLLGGVAKEFVRNFTLKV